MRRLLIAFVLLTPAFAWAERPQHYLVQTDHVLQPADLADLAARGIEVQRVLPEHRYLIRAESADVLEGDARLRSVEAYSPARKIAASAYREAGRAHPFAIVRVRFHDDVGFEDAQNAIEQAGGMIERALSVSFELPHGLVARVPSAAVAQLAKDERIFGIYGPPLRPKNDNAVAAQLSHVPPLFSAPYNLTGNGIVLSLFELASADTTHPEFGGRLTSNVSGSSTGSDSQHPTHVAGTMIAAGIDPRAKGMAPGATAQEFNALDDYAVMLDNKSTTLPGLAVVADNNSWGYSLGWQSNQSGSGPANVWYGDDELFGGYTALDSAPYDKVAHDTPVLFVHSAGNDASNGDPFFSSAFSPHAHVNNNGDVISGEVFCYSQDGTGTDCPAVTCSTGAKHCETVKHPTYGPFTTIGLIAATKNVIAVGAVDSSLGIAFFSSRGPARDGRVKPDIVAKGVSQYSTFPNGLYRSISGTSMSSPVVTGISALLTEQWRKTFNGQNPSPEILKMLFIAGADDLGNPGPDYTFGFGLADAQASVDLIRADNNTGSRIRTADIGQGQQTETTFGLSTTQSVRIVLGWEDPEVLLSPDDFAGKTLVNDLDLKVIDPSGNTVLPYVLDAANPNAVATRGVNSVDNIEELEISNAILGTYRVIVTGKNVATAPQRYVLIANAPLGTTAVTCTDVNEPNDTLATATPIASATPLLGRFCTQDDVDYFKFTAITPGSVSVTISARDTPVTMTMLTNGQSGPTKTIAAGSTGAIIIDFPPIVSAPGTMAMAVRVEPAGAIGSNASYTITATYGFSVPPRKRTVRH